MQQFIPAGPTRYEHQRLGLRRIIENRGLGALIFDPGMGKTAVCLDYASIMAIKMQRPIRVLVLAPLAAIDTWVLQSQTWVAEGIPIWAEAVGGSILQRAEVLEARHHFAIDGWRRSHALLYRDSRGKTLNPGRPIDPPRGPALQIEVINYDSFNSKAQAFSHRRAGPTRQQWMIQAVASYQPDLIVADESHVLRGPTSNTSKAIARLTDFCSRRIILTGTIMPHSPMDVFGQWRFLDPFAFGWRLADGTRNPATFSSFRGRFAEMGGYMGKEIVGFKNLDEMQDVMAKLAVVAHKEDALDLPEITDVRVPVDLSTKEAKAYADMKNDLATQLADGTLMAADNRLTQMMRLRQITSGYLSDTQSGKVEVIGTSKIKVARSLVHDTLAGEDRLVVFAHFRLEIEHLTRALAQSGTEIRVITGDTSKSERLAIRREFGSSAPQRIVLIAQMRTMSLAVNELVTASHAIYLSMSERREDWIQSRDRLHRIGQKRPVTIWALAVAGSVDEITLKSHQDRTNLENAMLRHIKGEI